MADEQLGDDERDDEGEGQKRRVDGERPLASPEDRDEADDAAEGGTVTVLTKASITEANTAYAQGGVASVWSVDDSFESHVEDTPRAGAGLCDRAAVESIVHDGPAGVSEPIRLGTRFTRLEHGSENEYDLGREGGHSHRRVLNAQDLTGQEIMRALTEAARRNPRREAPQE